MRITGDNPLIDPDVVDKAIKEYNNYNCDYFTNSIHRTFPNGTEVEIFSFNSLEVAWKFAKKKSEREHVTPFMKKNKDIFKQFNLKSSQHIPISRLTLDRKEDLKILKTITSKILKRPILFRHIFELFEQEPNLLELCNNTDPLEGYNKSLKEDKKFLADRKRY